MRTCVLMIEGQWRLSGPRKCDDHLNPERISGKSRNPRKISTLHKKSESRIENIAGALFDYVDVAQVWTTTKTIELEGFAPATYPMSAKRRKTLRNPFPSNKSRTITFDHRRRTRTNTVNINLGGSWVIFTVIDSIFWNTNGPYTLMAKELLNAEKTIP